jgi:hypothetical protein
MIEEANGFEAYEAYEMLKEEFNEQYGLLFVLNGKPVYQKMSFNSTEITPEESAEWNLTEPYDVD